MHEIYEETFKVRTWDVDRDDRLTPAAAFNYFQEAAASHARELGVGAEFMKANGQVWVLSRMSAVLERRPRWLEALRVRTWPRGTHRLLAYRDYEIVDAAGQRVARGRSGWLIVDTASLRPKRPEALAAGLPENRDLDALADGAQGLDPVAGLRPAGRRTAAYSDIDLNGHVNNARYIQWLQDLLPVERLAAAASMRIDINYLAEIREGESIDLYALEQPADGGGEYFEYFIEGRKQGSDTPSFRARLFWQ